ncbi:10511_t:CDS:2, partial [Racocetra persica]
LSLNMQSEIDLLKQENTRLMARIAELEQIAKEKNELENIEKQNRTVTNDLALQALLSRISPEYSTPLPNKSCSNGENAQIKDSSEQDQDLSLVNQDASTGSKKTITSLSLYDTKTVTKYHDLNNSDTTSEILESDNQIVEGLIQEMTYDQAENIVSSEINHLYSNNDEDMAP